VILGYSASILGKGLVQDYLVETKSLNEVLNEVQTYLVDWSTERDFPTRFKSLRFSVLGRLVDLVTHLVNEVHNLYKKPYLVTLVTPLGVTSNEVRLCTASEHSTNEHFWPAHTMANRTGRARQNESNRAKLSLSTGATRASALALAKNLAARNG
jgi:hypothetical protein